MKKRRVLELTVAAVLLFLFLGGPTPGSVGNCTESESIADPVQHCTDKEAWTCARRRARGDLASAAEEMACMSRITSVCSGATWPIGCEPTPDQSAACIEAMKNGGTLCPGGASPPCIGVCFPDAVACGTPPLVQPGCAACDQPPECNLCGATRSALTSDAGAD